MKKILELKYNPNDFKKLHCWYRLQLDKGEFEYCLVIQLMEMDFRYYYRLQDNYNIKKSEIYLGWLKSVGVEEPEKLDNVEEIIDILSKENKN